MSFAYSQPLFIQYVNLTFEQPDIMISFISAMKKMLLMGSTGVGKTSMHRVIFANVPARETQNIGYTVSKEEHKVILGELELNLWDCGSQDKFMNEYFNSKRETIFSRTSLLLYVFEFEEKEEKLEQSINNFRLTLRNLRSFSPKADIFVLVHKIDLIPLEEREGRFEEKKKIISEVGRSQEMKINGYFATTIWDESLYQAWSIIIQSLTPNRQLMRNTLKLICKACSCTEALLFEKSTFLMLSHYNSKQIENIIVFQRLAILLKTMKITFRKAGANIKEIQFSTANFSGMILNFTTTSSLMLISNNPIVVSKQICYLNIKNAGKFFKSSKLLKMDFQAQ